MTRLTDYALAALALIATLVAIGFFASLGLAVLGVFALIGLTAAAAAWIATLTAPDPHSADA